MADRRVFRLRRRVQREGRTTEWRACVGRAGALVGAVLVASAFASAGMPRNVRTVVRAGAISVSVPSGWSWTRERGGYRNCANPIVRLWAASYELPRGFAQRESQIVIPSGGVLLSLQSLPRLSGSRPWLRWRISNSQLVVPHPVAGSRYRGYVTLPGGPAVFGSAWFGSRPVVGATLAAVNRVLRSIRVRSGYGCM